MQLLTVFTVFLTALSVSAIPNPQRGGGFRGDGRGGRVGDINNGRIGGTGPAEAGAGSDTDNNSITESGNSGAIVNSPGSVISQSSTSCGNGGQIVCCDLTSNTATANSGRQSESTQTFHQFAPQLRNLFRDRISVPTDNNNRQQSNQGDVCPSVRSAAAGSQSAYCSSTTACCTGDFCTAMNIIVNTPVTVNGGRFPRNKA
ncbi:hypothetical protein TWF694_004973 [Orbilia ellipsospora]|uniref:Hydrophobin n=1 Tax=Orbilia ellipsospora TaxID=2528407 RepID=A0AAV9WWQ1_9PEZI